MAEKYFKKCSTSIVIREIKIKITVRFYLTQHRMTKIQKTNDRCWQGCRERETSIHWGVQTGVATVEFSVEIPQNVLSWSIMSLSHITLGHIYKRLYNLLQKSLFIHVHCCPFHSSQDWKQSWCPSADGWMVTMWNTCTIECYEIHRWMNGAGSCHWGNPEPEGRVSHIPSHSQMLALQA